MENEGTLLKAKSNVWDELPWEVDGAQAGLMEGQRDPGEIYGHFQLKLARADIINQDRRELMPILGNHTSDSLLSMKINPASHIDRVTKSKGRIFC